VNNYIFYQTQI